MAEKAYIVEAVRTPVVKKNEKIVKCKQQN